MMANSISATETSEEERMVPLLGNLEVIPAAMNLSISDIISLVSLAASLGALGKIFFGIAQTIATLQVKVDTMWDFTLRRAKSEAVMTGLANINSPIRFTQKAVELIAPFEERLRKLYVDLGGEKRTDAELAIEIERQLGQELLTQVSVPHNIYLGAVLLIAIAAAKGDLSDGGIVNGD